MDVIDMWTGRIACALQAALRMTNEAFAAHLGVAVRTVAGWHKDPSVVPRTEIQAALDTALERANETVQLRFARISRPTAGPAEAQALRVAIAVVVKADEVLLVCRRGDTSLRWQFPAGMVKPGAAPADVAIQETVAETGVHAAARRHLGERLHPQTGVMADYHLCEYLAGIASNEDVVENSAVAWVPIKDLGKFIPSDKIFPPILNALENA
ncbi:NUDIX hydrolase [Streptomyces candidus]|nr:NUDIX hydrolase [Streptomyces candidus]